MSSQTFGQLLTPPGAVFLPSDSHYPNVLDCGELFNQVLNRSGFCVFLSHSPFRKVETVTCVNVSASWSQTSLCEDGTEGRFSQRAKSSTVCQ